MSVLNQYLEKTPTEQRALVQALDAMIIKAMPNLVASLKWGNLTYHAEKNVCAIAVHKHHVNLQLWGGTSLKDPRGLLEGTGKTMRHIKFTPESKIGTKYIVELVRQAVRIANEEKGAKLVRRVRVISPKPLALPAIFISFKKHFFTFNLYFFFNRKSPAAY